MLPDRVSNPGTLTYESGALPIALRGPAQLDHKQASSGWGKLGKNDAKFLIHEPFELES